MDVMVSRDRVRGRLDLLSALALRWHTRLAGRFERELLQEPLDLRAA